MISYDKDGNMLDSGQTARVWEAANYQRAMEINDILDPMTIQERRVFVQTLTEEEKNGLIPEYGRRRNNEKARPGALVKPRGKTFSIWQRQANGSLSACWWGLAIVLGIPEHGSHIRYLQLLPHWQDKEGKRIHFCEAYVNDLLEVSERAGT